MASPVLTEPVPSPSIAFERANYCLILTVFSIVFDELERIFLGDLFSTPASWPQTSLYLGLLSCSWCQSNIKLVFSSQSPPCPKPRLADSKFFSILKFENIQFISALGRLRPEDPKFNATLGFIVRPCFKNKPTNTKFSGSNTSPSISQEN